VHVAECTRGCCANKGLSQWNAMREALFTWPAAWIERKELTLGDLHLCHQVALTDGVYDVLAGDDLAEHGMLAIEMWLR